MSTKAASVTTATGCGRCSRLRCGTAYSSTMHKKIILVSRCAWTLYNFRAGLMRDLKHRGATVIGGGAGGDGYEPKIAALGVPFVPLPVDKKAINPGADVQLFGTLYRWYRRERPDVAHHFTIKPVIYGSLAAWLAGVPRVVNTVTGLGFVFMEEDMAWHRPVRILPSSKIRMTWSFFSRAV